MTPIKYLLLTLIIGILLGAGGQYLFLRVQQNEEADRAYKILDFVIADWTQASEPFTQSERFTEETAQFAAKKELPTARLGYFPDTVRILAQAIEERYRVPAAVTMAQWALESAWGKNNLGVSNYFGHTFGATGKFTELKKYVTRTETTGAKKTLRFTVYKNIAEAFEAHGQYLSTSKHYTVAFYMNGPELFARVIAGKYAEDPEYAVKLIAIMRRYKL